MDIIRKHEIPGSEIKDFLTNSIEDSMSIMLVSVPPDLLPPTGVMQWVLVATAHSGLVSQLRNTLILGNPRLL